MLGMMDTCRNFSYGYIPFVVILFSLGIVACSGAQIPKSTLTPSLIPLTPFQTATLRATQIEEKNNQSPQSESTNAIPTATPFLYAIQSGDTLSVVAFRHNVSLQELLAANPGINPNLLIVGDEIIIPTGEGKISGIPTATPVALGLATPICYPNSDDSSWCYVTATNPMPQDLENVAARISIYSADGTKLEDEIAIPPLNLAKAEQSTILAALLPIIYLETNYAQAELLTSVPVSTDNTRYINIVIEIDTIEINGAVANVHGFVTVPVEENAIAASKIWIAVLAYDVNGQPIGTRKLRLEGVFLPGSPREFWTTVYSVGGSITDISVQGEARP